jgi:hypothetical protein
LRISFLAWDVLEWLFNLTKSNTEQRSLSSLVLASFETGLSSFDNLKHKHTLDCVRIETPLLEHTDYDGTSTPVYSTRVEWFPEQIPPVFELVQVGVKFKVEKRNNNLLDVTFKDGEITIPRKT